MTHIQTLAWPVYDYGTALGALEHEYMIFVPLTGNKIVIAGIFRHTQTYIHKMGNKMDTLQLPVHILVVCKGVKVPITLL